MFCLCSRRSVGSVYVNVASWKCSFSFFLQYNTTIDWSSLTKKECLKYGGHLVGNSCDYVPDITLMSFILFFGTYTCSMALKKFKTSRYFPTTVSLSFHPNSLFLYSFGVKS